MSSLARSFVNPRKSFALPRDYHACHFVTSPNAFSPDLAFPIRNVQYKEKVSHRVYCLRQGDHVKRVIVEVIKHVCVIEKWENGQCAPLGNNGKHALY